MKLGPLSYVKRLYESVVIPKMTYGLDTWFCPISTSTGSNTRRGSVGFAKRLGKVQRLAGILITGVIRTTANDYLDLHAHNTPIELRLNQLCFEAAVQICTLPASHPLHTVVKRAARFHSIRRHRSSLHNLMHTFQLNPDDFETIRPFPVPPSWKAQFTIDIATSKDAALERALERHRNFDLCLYSDGSGLDSRIGAACITDMRDDSFTRHLHLGSSTDHTVFESEVAGAILALPPYHPFPTSNASSSVSTIKAQCALFIVIDSNPANICSSRSTRS
ncbi:hypothetical protein R3P38DRAFT_2546190 [Favolaschia claudopus]|uniref:Reverse transcriptase/retrotransposon-derived protein RNase H-like domain-containing protein n=1 Tax=Favolaschia claudopus TaxID=2862362 RepID=A0AAV9ZDL6_9AGAR